MPRHSRRSPDAILIEFPTTHKACSICKATKPVEEFGWHRRRNDGKYYRQARCKACATAWNKARYERLGNKRHRSKSLMAKFGLTPDEYDLMALAQGYLCKLCGKPETAKFKRTGYVYDLAIDHCHTRGLVRGLLCQRCNNGLGCFRDNTELLQKAILYLQEHSGD